MSAVAERYAAALADVAIAHKSGEAVRKDLASFIAAYSESADLRNALETPSIEQDLKIKIVQSVAAKMGLNEAVRNFVILIVSHQRTHLFREINEAFGTELNRRLGIEEAEVTTARELSDAEKKELLGVIERRTGKKIEAKFVADQSVLGGAVVRVGSTVYDGSVREQLNRMRERLEAE
ncbi:MAG TPA: ATP synthase F1 subunit delta [Candidatus Acidoferrales bacterium]